MTRPYHNSVTRDAAISRVIEIEEQRVGKRRARQVHRVTSKCNGYDVDSPGRRIEVKGIGGRDPFRGLVLNSLQEYRNLRDGGWLYIVSGTPKGPLSVLMLRWKDVHLVRSPRWRVVRRARGY